MQLPLARLGLRSPGAALVAALVGVVALLLLYIRPAVAHTELRTADPADGADLARAPSQVTLTFGEAVTEPAYVVVTAPDGSRVEDGAAAVADATVRQPLDAVSPQAQAGGWTVAYRVVSVDGHAVTGELAFTVQPQAAGNNSAQTADSDSSGSTRSDTRDSTHAAHAADHSDASGWREYAHWLQLPLAALALGGLYVWSSPRRRRHA
jgi:hypothetical protein